MTGGVISMTGTVLTTVCVLALAYWCSRLLGKNWVRNSAGSHLKVIERLSVGKDSQLMLVKLETHVYLIGVSNAGIQMLTEAEGELEEAPGQSAAGTNANFAQLIKNQAALYQKKKRDINE